MQLGGSAHRRIRYGVWKLAEGEALIADLLPTGVRLRDIQLGNVGAESLDCSNRRVPTDGGQAQTAEAGSVTLIISAADSRRATGIDTACADSGTVRVLARWFDKSPFRGLLGDTSPKNCPA